MAKHRRNKKNVSDFKGPNSKYVKLISSDGYEFVVKRKLAVQSKKIEAELNDVENKTNVIQFKEIPKYVLRQVCKYLKYKARYTNSKTEKVPDFPVPHDDIVLKLLAAAYYLEL